MSLVWWALVAAVAAHGALFVVEWALVLPSALRARRAKKSAVRAEAQLAALRSTSH